MAPDGRRSTPRARRPGCEDGSGERARLGLLNRFQLAYGGEPVRVPVPARRLLAFLALADGPALRVYVAGSLWLDSSEKHAFGSLRSALWSLRRVGPGLVRASGSELELGPRVAVDVLEARALARQLLDSSSPLPSPGVELGRCLDGDLLPDWYEDWVALERERFRQLRLHALESLCERLAAAGRFGEAIEAGLAAVRADPVRESAHRTLVKVHLAEGNAAAAVEQYRLYRRLLNDQLGLAPSPQIEELLAGLTAN